MSLVIIRDNLNKVCLNSELNISVMSCFCFCASHMTESAPADAGRGRDSLSALIDKF